MKLFLALILSIVGTSSANAACSPARAKPGMMECQPILALPLQPIDLFEIGRPEDHPNAPETAPVRDLLNYLSATAVLTNLSSSSFAVSDNDTFGGKATVGGQITPRAVDHIANAAGDGTTDDTAAILAACGSGSVRFTRTYHIVATTVLNCDARFDSGAKLIVDNPLTINGIVSAADESQIFTGTGAVSLPNAPYVSVAWWGGLPSSANPEAGFRAAAGSNRTIKVPAGSYTMASTVAAPCCSLDPPTVRYTGLRNVTFDARGATFLVSNGISATTPAIFLVDSVIDFHARGGIYVGNRSGLTSGQESGAWELSNVVDSSWEDMRFTGNWGGFSAPFLGVWIVNSKFQRMTMLNVGQCFDFAFLKNVVIREVHGFGADANGASGANQTGAKCFSFLYDGVNAGNNLTGYSYTDNDGVVLEASSATNFLNGWLIASGQNYTLTGNHFYGNAGCSAAGGPSCGGAGVGVGGYVFYYSSGNTSSVGRPPRNITVSGDVYSGNGNSVAGGAGILIDTLDIKNSDVIANIRINAVFDNNQTNAIEANSAPVGTKLLNVVVDPLCTGVNQTGCVGGFLAGQLTTGGH